MDSTEIATLIGELEERIERLRALYDQYFMGLERLEPLILRKEVDRRFWVLRRTQVRNTRLRFRLESAFQRYNTFQQYWQRIVREIENGTYARDMGRAVQRFGENALTTMGRRRQKMYEKGMAKKAERDARKAGTSPLPAQPSTSQPPEAEVYEVPFDDSDFFTDPPAPAPALELDMDFGIMRPPAGSAPGAGSGSALSKPRASPLRPVGSSRTASIPTRAPMPSRPELRPAVPPVPPLRAGQSLSPERPGAQGGGSQGGGSQGQGGAEGDLTPDRLRKLYGQYVEAKRKANESTAAITYEKIAANLIDTAKQLRAKHKGQRVDFEVVMKDGTPVLKPVVKG